MVTKKTIAIIGATENVGSAIAGMLAKSPYRLLLMSEDAQKLKALENTILKTSDGTAEVMSNDCAKEASWEADIIILATPYEAEKRVAERIREVAVGKIVISTSNPADRSYHKLVTSANSSGAEELQKLLPYSSVVKAFNTTFASNFFNPIIDVKRTESFIAGNNSDAIDEVAQVVRAAGFDPMVVGDLTVSRALEQMQFMLLRLGMKNNYNWLAGLRIASN